jgi:uncharacterized membrane protein YidH (DUF202 family)
MTIEPGGVGDEMDPGQVRYSVLSLKTIWWTSALVVAVGVGLAIWLLFAYGHGDAQQRNQLEAIKTAGAIVVGTGGAVALLLAARRQRTAEIALKQKDRDQLDIARAYALQERVAAANEVDAVERRITELFTKAADQLGSVKAPVRLAGLYALERLAQTNPEQRQTVVNVLCAYLRMPYQPPDESKGAGADTAQGPGPAHEQASDLEQRIQEREVRLTAQQILTDHLCPGDDPANPAATFWPESRLNLTGAHLINFDLTNCHLVHAHFIEAQFSGVRFEKAQFLGVARFDSAQFLGNVGFEKAQFHVAAGFEKAQFLGVARFDSAQVLGVARFDSAQFTGDAGFGTAQFGGDAGFDGAQFSRNVQFTKAQFNGDALFTKAQFNASIQFDEAQFSEVASKATPPAGWTFEPAQSSEGEMLLWRLIPRTDTAAVQRPRS